MIQLTLCKSKLHRVTLTETNLDYHGSVSIDRNLMDAANLLPYERVQIANLENGSRLETYVLEGEAGSGRIGLNGAAAHLGNVGDKVLIISYASMSADEAKLWTPSVVFVDENNAIVEIKK